MQGFPGEHRVLVRTLAELDARDPSLIDVPLPVNSIPVAGPIASPFVNEGAAGNAQPSTSPGPTSGSGGGSGNGGSNGSGNNGGNSGGGSPPLTNPPISSSSGGIAFAPQTSIAPSQPSPNPTPGKPSSMSGAQSTSGGNNWASPSSPGGGGNYIISSVSSVTPGATATSPDESAMALGMSTVVSSTDFLAHAQSSQGSVFSSMGALSPTISTAVVPSSGVRLSRAAIAGIVTVCLISVLTLVLLVVRRRSIAHRMELRRRWWFNWAPSRSSSLPGEPHGPVRWNESSSGRLSARSSFATNFDQGLMFRVDSPLRFSRGILPDLPPTAEVRERSSAPISTAVAVTHRSSTNSGLNEGSEADTQYLATLTSQRDLDPHTPMSVRPFSPSELFFFPKPPGTPSADSPVSGAERPLSCHSSMTTLVQPSTPPRVFLTDLPLPSAPVSSHRLRTLTPGTALLPLATAANPSPDPFADPVKPGLTEWEIICRPFLPSLDDELAVFPGDHVCIFQVFEDGWAFVGKFARAGGGGHEQGLIPVDCFREADQPLPTFFAQKRVSYVSDEPIGCAL